MHLNCTNPCTHNSAMKELWIKYTLVIGLPITSNRSIFTFKITQLAIHIQNDLHLLQKASILQIINSISIFLFLIGIWLCLITMQMLHKWPIFSNFRYDEHKKGAKNCCFCFRKLCCKQRAMFGMLILKTTDNDFIS